MMIPAPAEDHKIPTLTAATTSPTLPLTPTSKNFLPKSLEDLRVLLVRKPHNKVAQRIF